MAILNKVIGVKMTQAKQLGFMHFKFAGKELRSLPDPLSRALVSTTYICQEIREFSRLSIFAEVDSELSGVALRAAVMQRGTLLRALGLKLDTFFDSWIHLLSDKKRLAEDDTGVLAALHSCFSERYQKLSSHPGYTINQDTRNRFTAHNDLVAAKFSISELEPAWEFDIFLSPNQADNTIGLMGEEIITQIGMTHDQSRKNQADTREQPKKIELANVHNDLLQPWLNFLGDAAYFCMDYNNKLICETHYYLHKTNCVPVKAVEFPQNRHATLEDFRLPLYCDRSEN